jgi:para-nitrobenzyl esterase
VSRWHRRAVVVAAVLVVLPLAACTGDRAPQERSSSGLVVATASGKVAGERASGVRAWRGIPFAAPPVGALRWRPPADVEPWDGVRQARAYGEPCLQGTSSSFGEGLINIEGGSEDCLTLNVNRPDDERSALPVMVWIHGGSFQHGSGSQPIYNSPDLVARGVVLVTVNYRLGRLGFFAHPALDEKVANFGLLDQVKALEWVRENIEGFGGDPDNVTVFGESAGGASVNALMASPAARGLFDKAISQSGLGRELSEDIGSARAEGRRLVEGLGLSDPDAAELRDLPATDVMGLPLNLLVGDVPIVDGTVLPARVAEVFEAGDEAPVPFLVGTTDLEVPDIFVQQTGRDPATVRVAILGDRERAAVAAYGGREELDQHLISDVLFTEPARHLADEHADDATTYLYRFSITSPDFEKLLGGAPHASEVPFVFDDSAAQRFKVPNAGALADTVSDYWVAFAASGTPSADGAATWPAYDRRRRILELTSSGPRAVRDPWTRRLDAVQQGYETRLGGVLEELTDAG